MKSFAVKKTPLISVIVSVTFIGAGCAGAQLARPDSNVDAVKHYAGPHRHPRSVAPPVKRSDPKALPLSAFASLGPKRKVFTPPGLPNHQRSWMPLNAAARYAIMARNHFVLARVHAVVANTFIRCMVTHRAGGGPKVQRTCLDLSQRVSLSRTRRGWEVALNDNSIRWINTTRQATPPKRIPGRVTLDLRKWVLPQAMRRRLQY